MYFKTIVLFIFHIFTLYFFGSLVGLFKPQQNIKKCADSHSWITLDTHYYKPIDQIKIICEMSSSKFIIWTIKIFTIYLWLGHLINILFLMSLHRIGEFLFLLGNHKWDQVNKIIFSSALPNIVSTYFKPKKFSFFSCSIFFFLLWASMF
jgi:hypothetical protein